MRSRFSSAQLLSEMPIVMVRRSRFCSLTMARVSAISCGVMFMRVLSECGCRAGAGAQVQLACGAGTQVRLSCGDNAWLLADDQPQGFLDYYT